MKIHQVELRHVRHFKELLLDLSAPLTVVGGPNGVGKTNLQKAILLAMFHGDKKSRDALVSRYDPHSTPQVTLHFSRGGPSPSISLWRSLTEEKGEWKEGDTIIKQKGIALNKVQEALPIGADAAALLLWGLQDDMAKVVSEFPSDGHTLLTQAIIKGAGPDPKGFAEALQKQVDKANKSGKDS